MHRPTLLVVLAFAVISCLACMAIPVHAAARAPVVLPVAGEQTAGPLPCDATDLSADAQWQGATGSLAGGVRFINRSATTACTLAGHPEIQLRDGQNVILPIIQDNTAPTALSEDAGGPVVLHPEQQVVSVFFQWRNYCQSKPAPPLTMLILLPGRQGRLVASGPLDGVPRCDAPTVPSVMSVGLFAVRDGAADVVRGYYGAINYAASNRRNYAIAYAALGSRMQHGQSYDDFVAGFTTTAHDDLHVCAVTSAGDGRAVVTVSLNARQRDGSVRRFTGAYTVASESGRLRIIAAKITVDTA